MSRTISAGTGKPYGLERVCRVPGFPRSTIYAAQARASSNVVPVVAQRRGPKPKMPDADLLEAIRADLAASPFTGEGHRKVRARLRLLRDIRVSRTRVLRLMRRTPCSRRIVGPRASLPSTTARSRRAARTRCGAPTACASRPWTTAGSGCSRRLIIAMPAASASIRSRRATASPPCSRSRRDCWANSAARVPMSVGA
jgi:hypothetical protein